MSDKVRLDGSGAETSEVFRNSDLAPARSNIFTEMLDGRALILVTGKGGTGKSTLVATLAELAAARRGSALAVEMSLHPRIHEMLASGSAVQTVCIDAEQAVSAALARLLKLPTLITRVFKNRFLRMFIRTSPAIREMILLDELHHLVTTSAPLDCPVIVDLPASGHALSFLDTPRSVHRLLRFGPLADVAERVETLFLDRSRCELVVVALPEELPVNESIDLVRRARELGLACRTVVVNQVPNQPLETEDRVLLDLLHQRSDGEIGRFTEVARGELDGADEARVQIERLRAAVGDPLLELPLQHDPDPRRRVATLVQGLRS